MNKVEKLDLMGVASLAFVAAAVLAAWMVTMPRGHEPMEAGAPQGAVTLTEDGRMKLTVTADKSEAIASAAAPTRTVSARPGVAPSMKAMLSIEPIR